MLEELLTAAVAAGAAGATYFAAAARVVKQYERGVVFRLGRLHGPARKPGFTMIVPIVDRLHKVNLQIVTMPVPAQEGITRDNVTVRVDAVVYFKVVDAAAALVNVEDYRFAVSQMAQTSLRSIIGKSDLDDLLSDREKLNQGLELMIDSPAIGWGVQIDRVEIKDVSLPDTMKRSMARQAEADRERRARVINADAELQASKKLAEAAQQMADTPSALQLRLLQTVVAVAAEKNSTLVLPFPVELLRFLERAAQPQSGEPVRAASRRGGDGRVLEERGTAESTDGDGPTQTRRGIEERAAETRRGAEDSATATRGETADRAAEAEHETAQPSAGAPRETGDLSAEPRGEPDRAAARLRAAGTPDLPPLPTTDDRAVDALDTAEGHTVEDLLGTDDRPVETTRESRGRRTPPP
ncbi:slipin family protein [Streptomyces sp. 15-116A]|uniref:slipin family protein n=1 Tax=Streptomyces sp. 15-116A TaxID=2259035 RepID=UPI0021B31322|nr:slipin family protein [Streptomyces sp. 15-116A]MCT7355980.1 slipin family protein [Streptomyces sp. 15-116A]